MRVLVVGLNGIGLMPTTPRKTRILLSQGKAIVVQMNPFTIRLLYKTGSATQDLSLGIDTGESHIGVAVVKSSDEEAEVLYKAQIDLRSSMEKRQLLETRKTYRRGRRYRKTRYRKPKFKHRRKRTYSSTAKKKYEHWHTEKENHQNGAVLDKIRKACTRKEYREPTFMNILRLRLFKAFPYAKFTYGNITNPDRKKLDLEKTHFNDAAAIALATEEVVKLKDIDEVVYIKQIRRKKRSLHEANPRKGRKQPNREAKRNNKNVKQVDKFHLYDTVLVDNKIGYISGFTGKSAYVVDFDGKYIVPSGQSYKQITLSKLKLLQVRTNNYIVKVA
ncbi:MAG: RRXRR domain-containing protein [Ruminococcus sp.]|nr:RRXRR domain-containing protein [Ruminococcus sp.]